MSSKNYEDEIINMLDSLTMNDISRIKINVNKDNVSENINASDEATPIKEYHHGRCDIGSPFARGCAFDVLE